MSTTDGDQVSFLDHMVQQDSLNDAMASARRYVSDWDMVLAKLADADPELRAALSLLVTKTRSLLERMPALDKSKKMDSSDKLLTLLLISHETAADDFLEIFEELIEEGNDGGDNG